MGSVGAVSGAVAAKHELSRALRCGECRDVFVMDEVAARSIRTHAVFLKVFALLSLPASMSHNRTQIFEAMTANKNTSIRSLNCTHEMKSAEDARELALGSIAAISCSQTIIVRKRKEGRETPKSHQFR